MTRAKPFTWIAAALFALVAVAHILRVGMHVDVLFGAHHIPMWVSYVEIVVAAFLSWMLCREARGAGPDQP